MPGSLQSIERAAAVLRLLGARLSRGRGVLAPGQAGDLTVFALDVASRQAAPVS